MSTIDISEDKLIELLNERDREIVVRKAYEKAYNKLKLERRSKKDQSVCQLIYDIAKDSNNNHFLDKFESVCDSKNIKLRKY